MSKLEYWSLRLAQLLLRPKIFNSITFALYWGFVALLVWWTW